MSPGKPAVGAGSVVTAGDSGAGSGVLAQPASIPTIASIQRKRFMLLILLEALLALALLLLIVWWTMFAGRKGGEPPAAEKTGSGPDSEEK